MALNKQYMDALKYLKLNYNSSDVCNLHEQLCTYFNNILNVQNIIDTNTILSMKREDLITQCNTYNLPVINSNHKSLLIDRLVLFYNIHRIIKKLDLPYKDPRYYDYTLGTVTFIATRLTDHIINLKKGNSNDRKKIITYISNNILLL